MIVVRPENGGEESGDEWSRDELDHLGDVYAWFGHLKDQKLSREGVEGE